MVEEICLPRFAPCGWGDFVPTFRKKVPYYSSVLWATLPTPNPEGEVGTFCRNVENKLPNHIKKQPQDLVPRYENRLQIVTSCSTVSFPVGNAASFPHNRSRIFLFWLISLLFVTRTTRCLAVQGVLPLEKMEGGGLKGRSWGKKTVFSPVTHTHTHPCTHTSNGEVWQEMLRKPSRSVVSLYKLYTTRN